MDKFYCGDELDRFTEDLERRTREEQELTKRFFEEQAQREYMDILTGMDAENRIH